MIPALVVMAILGCADGGDQCQTVQIAPTRYATIAACNAAAEATLGSYTGLTYPVVAASCQKAAAPALVEADATPAG